MTANVYEYLDANLSRYLAELIEFASIPSVSTDAAYATGMTEAARWMASQLANAGIHEVQILSTDGHPVVYGEWLGADGAPTILVYGHYDVQPPDPLDKWTTPPFEPQVREGRLYGRGVSDDKGPVLIPLKVTEAFLAVQGRVAGQRQVSFRGRGRDR